MDKSYITARREGYGRYEEKKSVFHAYISPIDTEEDAKGYLERVKSEYTDARHIAFAYINRGGNTVRFSDDGEPQGTAGMPILDLIKRENLEGVVIAVVRYFGGTLLGAGPLTRAYGKAAKLALDDSGVAEFVLYREYLCTVDYPSYNKIKYEFTRLGLEEYDISFLADVEFKVILSEGETDSVKKLLSDITSGRAKFEEIGKKYAPKK